MVWWWQWRMPMVQGIFSCSVGRLVPCRALVVSVFLIFAVTAAAVWWNHAFRPQNISDFLSIYMNASWVPHLKMSPKCFAITTVFLFCFSFLFSFWFFPLRWEVCCCFSPRIFFLFLPAHMRGLFWLCVFLPRFFSLFLPTQMRGLFFPPCFSGCKQQVTYFPLFLLFLFPLVFLDVNTELLTYFPLFLLCLPIRWEAFVFYWFFSISSHSDEGPASRHTAGGQTDGVLRQAGGTGRGQVCTLLPAVVDCVYFVCPLCWMRVSMFTFLYSPLCFW